MENRSSGGWIALPCICAASGAITNAAGTSPASGAKSRSTDRNDGRYWLRKRYNLPPLAGTLTQYWLPLAVTVAPLDTHALPNVLVSCN